MKNRIATTLGVLGLLLTTGCATTDKAPAADSQAAAQPAEMQGEVMTATFTVRGVDLKQRMIALKDKQGKIAMMRVGEEVGNLPQVKAGSQVMVKYYEATALRISKDTTGAAAPAKAASGDMRNTVEILANILAIDPKTRKITFQGPERALTVKAPADKDLGKLDVGDQVKLTYVEERVVAVEPAARAKPAKPAPSKSKK